MFVNNWSLICAGEYLILRGHVHKSTTFVDGTYVHTSNVKSIIADEAMKQFKICTKSGSEYLAAFSEISLNEQDLNITRSCLKFAGISADIVNACVFLSEQRKADMMDSLQEELNNGDLYLVLGLGGIEYVYFKYNDTMYSVFADIHAGMFKDSFLYIIPGILDFRHYEFTIGGFRTYHVSTTIKRLLVNNVGSRPLMVDKTKCNANEMTICPISDCSEGLLSRDYCERHE